MRLTRQILEARWSRKSPLSLRRPELADLDRRFLKTLVPPSVIDNGREALAEPYRSCASDNDMIADDIDFPGRLPGVVEGWSGYRVLLESFRDRFTKV